MSVQLLFKQATGNISADKFWVGFVARFWNMVDTKSVPCSSAVEISAIGLTLAAEKRERDGFSFPVFLHHKNRFDKKVAPRFYVCIEDPERVFVDCKFLESVDFVFAAKDGMTLAELGGSTSVTVFSSEHAEGLSLELYTGHADAAGVRFPLIRVDKGVRRFCAFGTVSDLEDYPGDMERYCEQHAAQLATSPTEPSRPSAVVSGAVDDGAQSTVVHTAAPPQPTLQAIASVAVVQGGNVSLSKIAPQVAELSLRMGWRTRPAPGIELDLDVSAFMLGETGKVRGDGDFIFYGQQASACSSVRLALDAPVTLAASDLVQLRIDLAGVPREVLRIAIAVTIDEADERMQSFSQVHSAFVRIVDADSGQELCRFDLADDYGSETSMIFGEIYRYKDDWKFKAVGQGFSGGLAALCRQFGVEVS